jgi:hypothetical protein
VAITQQRVKVGKWHNVYNRNKRLIGEWMVVNSDEGFSYKGYTFDKNGETEWDLTGSNPDYPTAMEAAKGAIDNIKHPD